MLEYSQNPVADLVRLPILALPVQYTHSKYQLCYLT